MAQTTNPQESLWGVDSSPAIKSYTLSNLRKIPQIEKFSEEQIFEMEVVAQVLPFKANNYVIEQLIDRIKPTSCRTNGAKCTNS